MRFPPVPHRWTLNPQQAMAIQRRLASAVRIHPPTSPIEVVVGVDAAISPDGTRCIGAAVVWEIASQSVIEQRLAERRLRFPYIPGLLSFREAPAIIAALRKLRHVPDAIMCDAQGYAHPRRLGLACHVGVLCDIPAIGCAKSRFIGEHEEPRPQRGARSALRDRGETVGAVLRTQDGVRPVYVSVGHKLDLTTAEQVVLQCAVRYRLPEPIRLADQAVRRATRT